MNYSDAMKVQTQEEADLAFEELTKRCMCSGKSREECTRIQKINLGYVAGYYDHDTRLRVERLFKCSHPIFGPATNGAPTAKEAFELGKKLGEKAQKDT